MAKKFRFQPRIDDVLWGWRRGEKVDVGEREMVVEHLLRRDQDLEDFLANLPAGGNENYQVVADAAARTALTAFDGLLVHQQDTDGWWVYLGASWREIVASYIGTAANRPATAPNGTFYIASDTGVRSYRLAGAWVTAPLHFAVANRAARLALSVPSGTLVTQTGDGSQWLFDGTNWRTINNTHSEYLWLDECTSSFLPPGVTWDASGNPPSWDAVNRARRLTTAPGLGVSSYAALPFIAPRRRWRVSVTAIIDNTAVPHLDVGIGTGATNTTPRIFAAFQGDRNWVIYKDTTVSPALATLFNPVTAGTEVRAEFTFVPGTSVRVDMFQNNVRRLTHTLLTSDFPAGWEPYLFFYTLQSPGVRILRVEAKVLDTPDQSFARVTRTANTTVPHATSSFISWDTEQSDNWEMRTAAAPTRLTVQEPGEWLFTTSINWQNNATGVRIVWFRKNGTTLIGAANFPVDAAIATYCTVSKHITMVPGDYIEVGVYQNSGGNLTAFGTSTGYECELTAMRVA